MMQLTRCDRYDRYECYETGEMKIQKYDKRRANGAEDMQVLQNFAESAAVDVAATQS